MKYINITIEELKKQAGQWAVYIDTEEMHTELKGIFKLCGYYGSCGYSNYGTHASSHKGLEATCKYWEREGKRLFVIKNQIYEIY